MRTVYQALAPLNEEARSRVWSYVKQRLHLRGAEDSESHTRETLDESRGGQTPQLEEDHIDGGGALDGISPVAVKWMKRSGLSVEELSKVFSIGLDEIDLVASAVPGGSKRERLHNVFRLTAIAEYLSSGAARVSHEDLKEACLHYGAYDLPNHAKNVKALGREMSGTKESGYTLSATGITNATKLIREMIGKAS